MDPYQSFYLFFKFEILIFLTTRCLNFVRTDWLLRFLYRSSAARVKVAGLGPIAWKDRRMMNVDVSSIVQGHLDYAANMDEILEVVGVRLGTIFCQSLLAEIHKLKFFPIFLTQKLNLRLIE